MKPTKIHFIVGIGRSGTTLLTSILNQHQKVSAAPENYFLLFFAHAYRRKKELSDKDIERILEFNRLFGEIQPYIGWGYNENELRLELNRNKSAGYLQIVELIYRHFKKEGKTDESICCIIDKNPSYSLQTERLSDIFPSAKFIIAVRDYRANLLSRKQIENARVGDTVLNCVRWVLFNKKLIHSLQRNPAKYHVVKYEAMVSDPYSETESLMQFLELESNPGLLEFYHKEKENLVNETYLELSKGSDFVSKKYSDMAQPINASRVETWKKSLLSEDIEIADIICSGTGRFFGYQSEKKIPFRRLKKIRLYFSHPLQVLMAYYDIYKDYPLYFVPVGWKFRRFKKSVSNRLIKHRQDAA